MITCKTHGCTFDNGCDCPKCLDEEVMAFSDEGEDPNPVFSDMSMAYVCAQCGCPISGAEADDNGGWCEDCAAGGEFPIDD